MKIKSNFKDYYDFVGHQYGGGDPMTTYVRDRIAPPKRFCASGDAIESGVTVTVSRFPGILKTHSIGGYRCSVLACAGKGYLVVKKWPDLYALRNARVPYTPDSEDRILSRTEHPDLVEVIEKGTRIQSLLNERARTVEDYLGVPSEGFVEASRVLNAPVFMIEHVSAANNGVTLHVSGKIPVLANLGLSAQVPPEQMFQELAYFIGNVMRVSPDLAPPVVVAEKDRIVQHGFDLKTSFRTRKKQGDSQ